MAKIDNFNFFRKQKFVAEILDKIIDTTQIIIKKYTFTEDTKSLPTRQDKIALTL